MPSVRSGPAVLAPEPLWVRIGNLVVVAIGVPIGARWQIGQRRAA